MTPFSFEWHWNADYLIFMGLLYLSLTVIACGLIYVFIKSWFDLSSGQETRETSEALSSRSRYPEY